MHTRFRAPLGTPARCQLCPGRVPGQPLPGDEVQRGGTRVAVVHHNAS